MTEVSSGPLPRTLDAAIDPAWLSTQLSPLKKGAKVTSIDITELIQINATKVRFKAQFEDGSSDDFCLKAFLDQATIGPNAAAVRESDFYNLLAAKLPVQVPECVAGPVDREGQFGIIIMRDLVVAGAHFCTALEPFDAARTAKSLDQLAKLHHSHASLGPLAEITWTPRQIDYLSGIMPLTHLQPLMNDQRSEGLPDQLRDAPRLLAGMKVLSAIDAKNPVSLLHGDCHAGNIFETADGGTGLIDWQLLQQGGWALDIAYHIAATLPVEVAEREERALLAHYLQAARSLGGAVPGDEEAWSQYRMAAIYGFFLWSITKNVKRPIIDAFFKRLGSSVVRHDSYKLLGV